MGVNVQTTTAADVRAGESQLRMCAVTRAQRPKHELIRFVAGPDGQVTPDLAGRLPGRGVWITASRAILEKALKVRAFNRSFKSNVSTSDELPGLVERLLVERAMSALSLANKAGLVVAGAAKVEAAIASGTARALLHGADGADIGIGKLDRLFGAVSREANRPALIFNEFTIGHLSLALGRPNVVHAAVKHGGAQRSFVAQAERLRTYRSGMAASQSHGKPARGAPSKRLSTGKV